MTYRVGLIGTGPRERTKERGGGFAIGRVHAQNWTKLPNADLVAACDIKPENLSAFAADFNIQGSYQDYREMLANERLDVVDICTWPPLHHEMVLAAVQAGVKAIYCEKPMCLSLEEAKDMVDACAEHGVRLAVSHQLRFDPMYKTAKSWMQEGRIGKVLEIHGRITGPDGDLLSWGTHWFDMFSFLLNDMPAVSVFAQIDCSAGLQRYGHAAEDRSLVCVEYEDDTRCYLAGDTSERPLGVWVIGENGMISMISTLQGWFAHGMEQPNLDPDYELMSAFELAMKDLLSSIEEQREPLLSGQLAYKTTEIIMAAYESANKQARVDLPLTTKTFPLLSRHAQAKG